MVVTWVFMVCIRTDVAPVVMWQLEWEDIEVWLRTLGKATS